LYLSADDVAAMTIEFERTVAGAIEREKWVDLIFECKITWHSCL